MSGASLKRVLVVHTLFFMALGWFLPVLPDVTTHAGSRCDSRSQNSLCRYC
jgi:hypothetical protein